jgi:CheY-like chemotaxis protein
MSLPAAQHPAMLLLDCHMPSMDGIGVLRAMAAAGLHVPTVIISGAATAVEREACLAAGALAFIDKPRRAEDLIAALRGLLAHALQIQEHNGGETWKDK